MCNTRPPILIDQSIQRHLTNFSLITHGFGSPAIVAALAAIQNYIAESLKLMDKLYPGELKSDLIDNSIVNNSSGGGGGGTSNGPVIVNTGILSGTKIEDVTDQDLIK